MHATRVFHGCFVVVGMLRLTKLVFFSTDNNPAVSVQSILAFFILSFW